MEVTGVLEFSGVRMTIKECSKIMNLPPNTFRTLKIQRTTQRKLENTFRFALKMGFYRLLVPKSIYLILPPVFFSAG